jgi:hypothetical protein
VGTQQGKAIKKMERRKKERSKSGRTDNKHQEKLWTCELI